MTTATLGTTLPRPLWREYYELTKPRIMYLVVFTCFTGMWLAAKGFPGWKLTALTLLGTGLASASSSVFNNYVDRNVDQIMRRTRARALPSGRFPAWHALVLGSILAVVSLAILWQTVNLFAAILAMATIAFYVLVYTVWLKRTTPLCTSIGGIAGATPPVIGWVAVTGTLDPAIIVVFLIMFLWQPPHFWALALLQEEDYRAAGLPMLPVVKGERVTKMHMLMYTFVLVPATFVLAAIGTVGWIYVALAAGIGAVYLYKTIQFVRKPYTPEGARHLFLFSILYLSVLFAAMFVDLKI